MCEFAERCMAGAALSKVDLNGEVSIYPLETFWCRIAFDRADSWNYKNHGHSFYELHLCLRGTCVFRIGAEDYVLQPYRVLLIPPNTHHRLCSISDDFVKFVWGFSADVKMPLQHFEATASMLHSIERIAENASFREIEAYALIRHELYYIFLSLLRRTAAPSHFEPIVKHGVRSAAIKQFIADNLASDLTVRDIATQFFLSERHLERICMAECRQTVTELKNGIRLAEIRRLLAETSLPISEIALRTGFADRYTMSKFFKRQEGISPGNYRTSLLQ